MTFSCLVGATSVSATFSSDAIAKALPSLSRAFYIDLRCNLNIK